MKMEMFGVSVKMRSVKHEDKKNSHFGAALRHAGLGIGHGTVHVLVQVGRCGVETEGPAFPRVR